MKDRTVVPLSEYEATRQRDSLGILAASDFAGKPVPEREWLVADLVPAKTVTLLGGDGGTGKSLLALQLGVAAATGGYWAGRQVEPSRCLYLSAEDDVDEIHRRLVDVAASAQVDLVGLDSLHIVPLAGAAAILASAEGKGSTLKTTQLFTHIETLMRDKPTGLVIFDTLADIFAGDENIRSQARQFIGILRGLCARFGATVLVLAHPSVAGMSNGSGLSGSTAWNNSVRSRLYFDRMKGDGGDEADPDIRVLRTMKANYGRTGGEIRMRWKAGAFVPDTGKDTFTLLAPQSKAERVFMALLNAYRDEGRFASPHQNAPTFAPSLFAKDQRSEGIKAKGFAEAMNRLFAAKTIAVGLSDGAPSKRRDVILATSWRAE